MMLNSSCRTIIMSLILFMTIIISKQYLDTIIIQCCCFFQIIMASIVYYFSDENPCGLNNGGCSDLCLLSAVDARNYTCACHFNTTLLPNMLDCLGIIQWTSIDV